MHSIKMQLAESTESPEWTKENWDETLKNLKNNKSRDYEGLINELFKKDVIGDHLKKSMLQMYTKLKKKKMIALFINFANITTVPKKGSRLLLNN